MSSKVIITAVVVLVVLGWLYMSFKQKQSAAILASMQGQQVDPETGYDAASMGSPAAGWSNQ